MQSESVSREAEAEVNFVENVVTRLAKEPSLGYANCLQATSDALNLMLLALVDDTDVRTLLSIAERDIGIR